MIKDDAIFVIEYYKLHFASNKNAIEAFDMAISALENEPSISDDGTLTVNVEDGSKVGRVLVSGNNHFGGLYYPDQELKTGHCKDCKHFCELPHHTETLGRCTLHDLRFYPKGDWYCADFESKGSEDKE
jgi:hypothetical protein